MKMKTARKSSTPTPMRVRLFCAGAVVYPRGGLHLFGGDAQHAQRGIQLVGGGRAKAQHGRRGECQPPMLLPYLHQACPALLDDVACVLGRTALGQPGMAAAQGGMAGQGRRAASSECRWAMVGSRHTDPLEPDAINR